MENKEININFIVIGDEKVGKTQIMNRYINGEFNNHYQATSIDIFTKKKKLDNDKIIFNLKFYDTGGKEVFKSIRQNYYKGIACAIIVYDITNKSSLDSVDKWIEECNSYSNNENLIKVLIGNQTDRSNERKVTEEQGKTFAKTYDMDFYEVSASNEYNIKEIFENLLNKIYNLIKENKKIIGISKRECENNIIIDNEDLSALQIHNENNENNENNRDNGKSCYC